MADPAAREIVQVTRADEAVSNAGKREGFVVSVSGYGLSQISVADSGITQGAQMSPRGPRTWQ